MKVLSLFLLAAFLVTGCTKIKDRDTIKADRVLATLNDEEETYNVFTTQTPTATDTDGPYEMGMKFKSTQIGNITQIRYYKYSGETGTHIGRLWSAGGTELASVTFTGETASGWQTATLSTPYEIVANTVYVVTVNSNTRYGATPGGLASAVTNGPLSTVVGSNGVFGTTLGAFPTSTYNGGNYFRDVTFEVIPDVTAPSTPTSVTSSDITGYGVDLSWTASTDNVHVTGYNVYNDTVLIASVTGTWANIYGLTPSTAHSIKVKAKDAAGNLSAASTPLSVTTGAAGSGLRGWQIDTTTVGLTGVSVNKNTLPLHSDPIAAGSTISLKKLVNPDLSAGNIIIDRCWIVINTGGSKWNVGSDNGAILIKDSRIEAIDIPGKYATAPFQSPTNKEVTLLRTEITDQGGGFWLDGAALVRNCYIHNLPGYGDPATDTGNHVDGGTRRNGIAQLNVIDNHIDIRSAGNNASSAFFIQPLYGFIDNILLRGNLLGGGGYTVYGSNHNYTYGTHIYADNNRWYTGAAYGYVGTPSGPGFGSWTNNYVNNPANTDNKGTVITYP
ncbi:DUF4082 domain-containing protein [Chitinophaga sp. YIM B06452]|uniref:DUF4082 domain-containing protein n=1 Tax=Chitinophaga sp. YIM B06452 TaxID=3082158 RepID=UPI0031FED9B1